jgi:hypothetical protein
MVMIYMYSFVTVMLIMCRKQGFIFAKVYKVVANGIVVSTQLHTHAMNHWDKPGAGWSGSCG